MNKFIAKTSLKIKHQAERDGDGGGWFEQPFSKIKKGKM